jgi:hypothetical protein
MVESDVLDAALKACHRGRAYHRAVDAGDDPERLDELYEVWRVQNEAALAEEERAK